MSLPKEPRQLMINLMYLVLTAMLALNVSSEILHAFRTINQSISASNVSIVDKNTKLYESFDENENMAGQRERVKPFNDRAKQVKSAAEDVIKYLDGWKERIITESGGKEDNGTIKREDNIDASTLMLVERKGGDSLKARIAQFRELLLNAVEPQDKATMAKQLPVTATIEDPQKTDNNPRGDWSTGNFYNMPTMAVITLMSKFQNDVRNSEALVVNQLFNEAASKQVRFDAFKAIAVPKNSYALAGQKVEASILLAAYNTSVNPTVSANIGRVTKVEQGEASWETQASGTGLQTVKGTVTINMGGQNITKDYSFQYMVGSTGASMQLDKMNVFYIGVPNPITVTAAGYSLEDVSVSIPGATITPGEAKGKYNVQMTTPGKITAVINAKTADGVKQVGAQEIRVKYIPDPVGKVGGKSGGVMPSNIFKAQLGIVAALENFDFDTRFIVTSFDFSMLPKRGELIGPFTVNSPKFDANRQVTDAISRAKPGDKIFLENIRAVGPDKKSRALNTISLTLQ